MTKDKKHYVTVYLDTLRDEIESLTGQRNMRKRILTLFDAYSMRIKTELRKELDSFEAVTPQAEREINGLQARIQQLQSELAQAQAERNALMTEAKAYLHVHRVVAETRMADATKSLTQ